MAGLDFRDTGLKEQEAQSVVAYNTRLGVILFFVYLVFYGGFMALSAFSPHSVREPFLGGVNLGIVYGFALIVAALVLAAVYLMLCRKST